jgi:hypothetical protein
MGVHVSCPALWLMPVTTVVLQVPAVFGEHDPGDGSVQFPGTWQYPGAGAEHVP